MYLLRLSLSPRNAVAIYSNPIFTAYYVYEPFNNGIFCPLSLPEMPSIFPDDDGISEGDHHCYMSLSP